MTDTTATVFGIISARKSKWNDSTTIPEIAAYMHTTPKSNIRRAFKSLLAADQIVPTGVSATGAQCYAPKETA